MVAECLEEEYDGGFGPWSVVDRRVWWWRHGGVSAKVVLVAGRDMMMVDD